MFKAFGFYGSLPTSSDDDELSDAIVQDAALPITENELSDFQCVDFTTHPSSNGDAEFGHPTAASNPEDSLGSAKDDDQGAETKEDTSSSNENELEVESAVQSCEDQSSSVDLTSCNTDSKTEDNLDSTRADVNQGDNSVVSNENEGSSAVKFDRPPNTDVELGHPTVALKPEDGLQSTKDDNMDHETKEDASILSNENLVESNAVQFDQSPNNDLGLRHRRIAPKPEDGPSSSDDDNVDQVTKDASVSSDKNKAQGMSAVKIYLFDNIAVVLGFVFPISAALIGFDNINQCPGALYLPYVVSIMGLFSFFILAYAALHADDGDFNILKENERNVIEWGSMLFAFLWLGEFVIFATMEVSFDSSAANYCSLWFYIFVVIWNLFLVLVYCIGYNLLFLDAEDVSERKRRTRRISPSYMSIFDTDESE